MMGPGASGGGMSFPSPVEWILCNSTTCKVPLCRIKSQSLMFASPLPGFVMSMISGAVLSDFFSFDFGAGFQEHVVFEPWVPHFEPIGGIAMTSTSQLDTR